MHLHSCRYKVDVTQTPLSQTMSSHLLQWWQALDGWLLWPLLLWHIYPCSVWFAYVSPPLGWFGYFISVSGSHDSPFLSFYYYLHMGGPGLSLEHLLWVTPSFLTTMQLPVIDKHKTVLFSISSSSLGELWHLCLACAPALLPGNLCLLASPKQAALLSHLLPVFKAVPPSQLLPSPPHTRCGLTGWNSPVSHTDLENVLYQIFIPTLKMNHFSLL